MEKRPLQFVPPVQREQPATRQEALAVLSKRARLRNGERSHDYDRRGVSIVD